jgi:hypothetical protein
MELKPSSVVFNDKSLMISKELADPFGLLFKYRKILFSNILVSILIIVIIPQIPKQIKPRPPVGREQ